MQLDVTDRSEVWRNHCLQLCTHSWFRQVSVDRFSSMVTQMIPFKLNGEGTGKEDTGGGYSNEQEIRVSTLNCGKAKGLEYCDLGSVQCWELSGGRWFLIENSWQPAWNTDILDSEWDLRKGKLADMWGTKGEVNEELQLTTTVNLECEHRNFPCRLWLLLPHSFQCFEPQSPF